jgi:SAM-dependent methyltransferase
MKRIHVDENVTVRTDEEANIAFLKENDIAFFEDNKGIVKVTKERWEKAQRTERKHWMEIGKESKDDRNIYHKEKFDNYNSIKNSVFNNALEVGCGPFTNLRIVGDFCKINACSLNDPLINSYLTHTNCAYTNNNLILDSGREKKSFLDKFFRKKIKIKKLYDCAFEDIESAEKFDLIVIINVIEHCYDLDIFFSKILSLLADNGVLIFEDKLYSMDSLKEDVNTVYDAAHPLRVNKEIIIDFLKNNFDKLYSSTQDNSAELGGKSFLWDDIYFIGSLKK